MQQLDIRGHMHRLHAPERVNPLPFTRVQKVGSGAAISRPRIPAADVDGELFNEAQCRPIPGPGDERGEHRPHRLFINGSESRHGGHLSYTSRRCAIRVTLTSFAASSIMYTTRQSPTRMRH